MSFHPASRAHHEAFFRLTFTILFDLSTRFIKMSSAQFNQNGGNGQRPNSDRSNSGRPTTPAGATRPQSRGNPQANTMLNRASSSPVANRRTPQQRASPRQQGGPIITPEGQMIPQHGVPGAPNPQRVSALPQTELTYSSPMLNGRTPPRVSPPRPRQRPETTPEDQMIRQGAAPGAPSRPRATGDLPQMEITYDIPSRPR